MEYCRSPLLTQLFGVVDSDPLTLVAYEGRFVLEALILDAKMFVELVDGHELALRYRGKHILVYRYLRYIFVRLAPVPLVSAVKCFFRVSRSNLCATTRLLPFR